MRKRLDRLTLAQYSIGDSNEAFTIDDLGNRDLVTVRDGNKKVEIVNYNRWLALGIIILSAVLLGPCACDTFGEPQGPGGAAPRVLHGNIIGGVVDSRGNLTLVTAGEHDTVNLSVGVQKCDLQGRILGVDEFVVQRAMSIRSTTDPCMPVIWISSSSYISPGELWAAEHDGTGFDRKLLFREETNESLWLQKCWFLEVAGGKVILIQKQGTKKVYPKGKLNLLPVYWLYCYELNSAVLRLKGKALIREGATESYEVTVECGVVDDKIQVWACDHLDEGQVSILRVARWRDDGKLEWAECGKLGDTGSVMTIDPDFGSVAIVFERRRRQPYSTAVACYWDDRTSKCSSLGYGFGGKHQLVRLSEDNANWLLLDYEGWHMRILALDGSVHKVKELERTYPNSTDLHLFRGPDQSRYAVILYPDRIRVEELPSLAAPDWENMGGTVTY